MAQSTHHPLSHRTRTITNKNTNGQAQHVSKSSAITPTCPTSDFFVTTYVSAWQLEYQLTKAICSIILLTTKNWQQQEFVQHPRFCEPVQLTDESRGLNYFSGAIVRLIKNLQECVSLLDQKTIKPTCPTSDFMTAYVHAWQLGYQLIKSTCTFWSYWPSKRTAAIVRISPA